MFVQDPLFGSKLICRLTGDTINKTEEHIWKHISGRRFLNRLEQEELEKETLSKSGKQQRKRKAAKASKSSKEHLKSKKKRQDCDNGGKSVSEPVNDGANTTVLKMDPGPINPTILHLQSTHRSQLVWTDQSANCLHCRRREAILHRTIDLDPRMVPYLKQSGFWGVTRIGFTQLDWHLITALVERWRPETHTFHMPGGECTITLQDIAIQFGLPVDGKAVTGSLQHDWPLLCEDLLGVRPPQPQLRGSRLSLPWLGSHFTKLPLEADEVMIKRHTRAYIMQLIGGFLFADKSSTFVHLMFLPLLNDFEEAGQYSWGSACLAWLYRELCRASQIDTLEIAGPLILLQVWAWDRFPTIAPQRKSTTPNEHVGCPLSARWSGSLTVTKVSTHVLSQYRYTFDRLTLNEMVWIPYTPEIMSTLPTYCLNGQDIWLTISPLICFHIIEWHRPDRVLRQFKFRQCVPPDCDTDKQLHQLDLRSKCDNDWGHQHAQYISAWGLRRECCASGEPMLDGTDISDNYFSWYNSITRRYITPQGAAYDYMGNIVKQIYNISSQGEIKSLCESCFKVMDDLHGRNSVRTNDVNKQQSSRRR